MFVEVFAGTAGLSAAVEAQGIKVDPLSDFTPDYQQMTGFGNGFMGNGKTYTLVLRIIK